MLLWLSLLLCSGACWAHELLGAGGGWNFNSPPDNTNDITGIQVSFGDTGLMKSIRLRFGSAWSPKYGVEGGRTQTFVLQPGEHITSVYGTAKAFIRYLVFYTDQGRWVSFGNKVGNHFTAQGDLYGKVLTGVFGQHRLLGITGIGFDWDYPLAQPEAPTPAPKPETTLKSKK
ncbi:zymogen granule protein 16 homolog B [Sorex fumeus]|uniref:zymogen granule protein 16 homolog B n=1 Tax=Sorex fumeus TaxID=62283 RepID=UPI0024ADB8B2|nr:zymogen granule protein 16 homolog B [Sorex fumeus]